MEFFACDIIEDENVYEMEENKTNEQPEGVVESFKMIFFMFVDIIGSAVWQIPFPTVLKALGKNLQMRHDVPG